MENKTDQILKELKEIRIDIEFIKEDLEDRFLSAEDISAIEEAEKEFKEGKAISHEKLKEELGI